MKKQELSSKIEAGSAALPAGKLPILQLDYARRDRKLHIASPRRQLCAIDRKIVAALRAAELAAWQASGGDFLRSSRAGDLIRAYAAHSN